MSSTLCYELTQVFFQTLNTETKFKIFHKSIFIYVLATFPTKVNTTMRVSKNVGKLLAAKQNLSLFPATLCQLLLIRSSQNTPPQVCKHRFALLTLLATWSSLKTSQLQFSGLENFSSSSFIRISNVKKSVFHFHGCMYQGAFNLGNAANLWRGF